MLICIHFPLPTNQTDLWAPTNLVARAISSNEITLQWDKVSDADYYYVYLSNDDKTFIPTWSYDGSKIQNKWLPGYSFKLYVTDSNTWSFKVTAVKNKVESVYSSVKSATTSTVAPITPITPIVPRINTAPVTPATPVTPVTPVTPDSIESSIDDKSSDA